MTERIPLGERENLHREFKGRDALKKLETIAREVVAMLNADGGTLWVGLRDEGDRAVAVEPISDAERERRRLRDYLVDTIEPSPAAGEVEVAVIPAEAGGEILVIHVRPRKERAPYAHLKEGGRFFLIRVEDRTRPMAREEIFFQPNNDNRPLERLREEREQLEGELFWLGIEPVPELDLDPQDQRFKDYLSDPSLTGNRLEGWSFARLLYPPRLTRDALVAHPEDRYSVEIRRAGGLRFKAPLKSLYWKGDPRELWPYSLLEYLVSAFRMARRIYEGCLRPEDLVFADLALIGLGGWKLRPGSIGIWGIQEASEFTESKDLIFEKPFVFSFGDVEDEPDRCGLRLVERVYEAFGLRREAIPQEFDRKAGRLILPE